MQLDRELDKFEQELITPAHIKDLRMLELHDEIKDENLVAEFGEN